MYLHRDPGNRERIDEFFVFLADSEGVESVCAMIMPNLGSMPMMTSSAKVAELWKHRATEYAAASGKKVMMVHYVRGQTMWRSDAEPVMKPAPLDIA